jgi:predicted nuclease with RNAse H fold
MTSDVFVGVDVGGTRKGFHAVALQGHEMHAQLHSLAASEVADWCNEHQAFGVAIDAPCRWSQTGRARAAEQELARLGISAFATPSRALAESKTFYSWMLNGAQLYGLVERSFPLFSGREPRSRFCVETFPQAVACALAGKVLPAKQKSTNRPAVLLAEGIDTSSLKSGDFVDAALCAVAAQYVAKGAYKAYGEERDGFIVVPSLSTSFSLNS